MKRSGAATQQMKVEDDEAKPKGAPKMSRSRGQLAAAYAPGAFFTFEGGQGACIAIPDPDSEHHELHNLPDSVATQIVTRMDEAVRGWFERAFNCRDTTAKFPVDARLCIEPGLLNADRTSVSHVRRGRILFVNPVSMGYAPAPLTFACNRCKLFRYFKDTRDLHDNLKKLSMPSCRVAVGRTCQWRQLDVIFVHWSGGWLPVMPGRYDWDQTNSKLRKPVNRCGLCHSEDFLLHSDSPNIGKWFFECANPSCRHVDAAAWIKNDPETVSVFGENLRFRIPEVHMEPISYRASQAYYAQSEQFVIFSKDQEDLLNLLDPSRTTRLSEFIARRYGYGGDRPPMEEIRQMLLTSNHTKEWHGYENKLQSIKAFRALSSRMEKFAPPNDPEVAEAKAALVQQEAELESMVDSWFAGERPILQSRLQLPMSIQSMISERKEYASRYDPFRLSVEHEALTRSKLKAPSAEYGRRPFVNFVHLDDDLAPKDERSRELQRVRTGEYLKKLGFATMGLIREFDLCRFTYGYTRMQSVPYFEKRGQNVPVRLNLFPPVDAEGGARNPVYVVAQANEAIYVQLDERAVYNWLKAVSPADMFDWSPESGKSLGGELLERARNFGRYLENVPAKAQSSVYLYAYTLLHTFSHVMMKAVAEFSGLDLGSLSEYLFPTDLAFVVYRNGTTMDLGNLSALWRNSHERFLEHLLDQKTLTCNSGSLCDSNPKNPGACPDCILVPETSCVAMNQMLSRSVLRGGPATREDGDHANDHIAGFLRLLNENA